MARPSNKQPRWQRDAHPSFCFRTERTGGHGWVLARVGVRAQSTEVTTPPAIMQSSNPPDCGLLPAMAVFSFTQRSPGFRKSAKGRFITLSRKERESQD